MLLLSGTGIADESVGPWALTISTNDGGPAANNIDIELTVVLDESKKVSSFSVPKYHPYNYCYMVLARQYA